MFYKGKMVFIEYLDEYQKDSISGLMLLQKFSKNEYIIKEKDQALAIYVLKEVFIRKFIILLIKFIKNS